MLSIAVKSGDISVQEGKKVVYVGESDLHEVLLEQDTESPVSSLEELHAAVPSAESESHASAFSSVAQLQGTLFVLLSAT